MHVPSQRDPAPGAGALACGQDVSPTEAPVVSASPLLERISLNLQRRLRSAIRTLNPHLSRGSWSTLDALVGPLLSFAVSPILLARLDTRGFGLWAFGVAITGFGGLASMGVGVAVTKYVAEDRASGRPQDAVATTRAAMSVALVGGLMLLVLGALLTPFLAKFAFVRMGPAAEVSAVLMLGITILAVQEIDSVFTGGLRGAQRFDVAAQIEISIRLLWVGAVVGTAWMTRSATDALIASVVVGTLKVVVKGVATQKILKGPCMMPSRAAAPIQRVLHMGKWLWVQGVGGLLFSVVDRLAVGAIFGPIDLARYSVCMQLAQLVHGVQATALQPLVPWISSRLASRQSTSAATLTRIAVLGGMACTVVPLALLTFADTFLGAWIGVQFAQENSGLCRVLLAAYGLLAFNIPVHYLLLGLGNVSFLATTNIFAGVVSLGTSLLLSYYGFTAFVLGKLLFAPLIFLNFIALRKSAHAAVNVVVDESAMSAAENLPGHSTKPH